MGSWNKPMLESDFLAEFKRTTEAKWNDKAIDPAIYGFQFQRGTRWNPGLPEERIAEYENVLGVRFPHDFKTFLRAMNGTDLPTLNIYGYCGEPPRQSVGVYSYPRDIEVIKERIEDLRESRAELTTTLAEQGFDLPMEANLVPIFIHRYIVCGSNLTSSAVLSVFDGSDAIVYGNTLRECLEIDFLRESI
jgi:hypothetical protein